jgi:hypothetical protein
MKKTGIDKISLKKLLNHPFSSLDLGVKGSVVEERMEIIYQELTAKKLLFKPHIWISEEWFTPDNIPGFAVPFYLFHPRLVKLEKRQMFEAEGASKVECLKIMRHETGHAIAHAFKVYSKKSFLQIFGNYKKSYPLWYIPVIQSKKYVTHLNAWYAQAHPIEDFAETFAVWLNTSSNWQKDYKGWQALDKLYYMDNLMRSFINRRPLNRSEEVYAPLNELNHTLHEHYINKKRFYTIAWPEALDQNLKRIFKQSKSEISITQFFRKKKNGIREIVSSVLDVPQYTVEQIILGIKNRCRELNLISLTDEEKGEKKLIALITSHMMNSIHSGYHRIPL